MSTTRANVVIWDAQACRGRAEHRCFSLRQVSLPTGKTATETSEIPQLPAGSPQHPMRQRQNWRKAGIWLVDTGKAGGSWQKGKGQNKSTHWDQRSRKGESRAGVTPWLEGDPWRGLEEADLEVMGTLNLNLVISENTWFVTFITLVTSNLRHFLPLLVESGGPVHQDWSLYLMGEFLRVHLTHFLSLNTVHTSLRQSHASWHWICK